MSRYANEMRRPARTAAIAASWRGILNVIPAAAYTCDAAGQITYFNPRAELVWGRAPKLRDATELYCGSQRMYLPDGTPITHGECWMALALLQGSSYHGREIVIERQDGGRTAGMAYAHPVRDTQGRVIGAVNMVADITACGERGTHPEKPPIPFDATLAMIEIAVAVFAGMQWTQDTFS